MHYTATTPWPHASNMKVETARRGRPHFQKVQKHLVCCHRGDLHFHVCDLHFRWRCHAACVCRIHPKTAENVEIVCMKVEITSGAKVESPGPGKWRFEWPEKRSQRMDSAMISRFFRSTQAASKEKPRKRQLRRRKPRRGQLRRRKLRRRQFRRRKLRRVPFWLNVAPCPLWSPYWLNVASCSWLLLLQWGFLLAEGRRAPVPLCSPEADEVQDGSRGSAPPVFLQQAASSGTARGCYLFASFFEFPQVLLSPLQGSMCWHPLGWAPLTFAQ